MYIRDVRSEPTHSTIERVRFSLSGDFYIIGRTQRRDRLRAPLKILVFLESHPRKIVLSSDKTRTRDIIIGEKNIWMLHTIHEFLDLLGSRF